ncbi:MAG: hypothetical protein LBS60_05970 [Deltaproteobacteria bacterium]|jgi:hypothetical protein|nr:hypothetical protein [Deltaproteobacteria bacterium]
MKNFFANQIPLFILSLVLAFILWLTVSGQDMSVHDLTASLEFLNLPANMALEEGVPESVNLRIEANTAQFRFLEGRKYHFRYDLSTLEPGLNIIKVDYASIIPQLPRGIRVARVYPEEISLNVFPYITKEVPVVTEVVGELPSYLEMVGNIMIEPANARVTGPENRLAAVNQVSLSPARLSDFRTAETNLLLSPQIAGLDTWLTVEPKVFRVKAQIVTREESTSFTRPVALDTPIWNGPPAPLSFRPDEAKVRVSWTLDHPAPRDEEIKLTVVLTEEDLLNPGNLRLPIKVTAPSWVKVLAVEPTHLVISKVRRPDILKP